MFLLLAIMTAAQHLIFLSIRSVVCVRQFNRNQLHPAFFHAFPCAVCRIEPFLVIRRPNSLSTLSGTRTVAGTIADSRVRLELLDIAAHNGWLAGVITVVVMGFVWALLFGRASGAALLAWAVSMILGAALRIGLSHAWASGRRRHARRKALQEGVSRVTATHLERWEVAHAVVGLLCGSAWAMLVFAVDPNTERVVFLVGLALTVALILGNSSYAASRLAYLLFAIPIVVTQEVNLLRLQADLRDLLAVAWPALAISLYFLHRAFANSLFNNLVARIDQERSAAEQKALVETAPLGILVVRDMRITICNDALLKILGFGSKEDLLGKSVRMLIPDDTAWREALEDGLAAMHGPVRSRIVRRRRADGTVVDIKRDIAAVERGNSGTGYIGIYEDVNERAAIEEGFRHAVHMQRLVFESAGEGIAIVNEGIIEQANQALADLVGMSIAQLKDRPFQSLFEDPKAWAEIEKQFERLGNTLKLERRIVRSDGRALWACVTGRPVGAHLTTTTRAATDDHARSIWIVADLTALKAREAESWHQANHDVLTGLPNRRFLQDRLDQALALARRDGRRVAILALDLDGFKSVNDMYGHPFGDAVLEEVARRLSSVVRELDTVGRWGGDEFVLVLKEIESRAVVEVMVERVIARLSEPMIYRGQRLSVGVSIGIALYPDHGDEVEKVMLAADLAMYESKASGGNAWRFASANAQTPRGKYRPALAPEA